MPDYTALMPAAASSVADAAISGLSQPQKTLPAKLFYDEEGCRLFASITELPEYYLTRTELALLADVAPRLAAELPGPAVLIEYGASDEAKAEFLLRERDRTGDPVFQAYVPIDVAVPAAGTDAEAAATTATGAAGVRVAGRLHGCDGTACARSVVAAARFLSGLDDRQSGSARRASLPAAGARRRSAHTHRFSSVSTLRKDPADPAAGL